MTLAWMGLVDDDAIGPCSLGDGDGGGGARGVVVVVVVVGAMEGDDGMG